MSKKFIALIITLVLSTVMFSQEILILKEYKEDFCARTFVYSNKHYFARLSYNNKTIYIENLVHPRKRTLIFSRENKGIKTMDFDSEEKYLIVGAYSGDIDVWGIDERKLLASKSVHTRDVNIVKFIPNTHFFISAGFDGKILLSNVENLKAKPVLIGKHKGIIRSLDIFDKGKYVAVVGNDCFIRVWDVFENTLVREKRINSEGLSYVKVIKKLDKIIVGDIDGNIYILNKENLLEEKRLKPHTDIISSILYLNGDKIITSSYDGCVKVINISNKKWLNIDAGNGSGILHTFLRNSEITFSNRKKELKVVKILNE